MNHSQALESLKEQFRKKTEEFNDQWHQSFKQSLENELEGDNRLYYLYKMEEDTREILLSLRVKSASVRSDNYSSESDTSITVIHDDKTFDVSFIHYPGDETSQQEEEREDYYEVYKRRDNSLFPLEQSEVLSTLFQSISFFDQIMTFYHFHETLHDDWMSQYDELYRQTELSTVPGGNFDNVSW